MVSKQVGQTVSSGFQVGVRRTLPIALEEAWAFITSSKGIAMWLGDVEAIAVEKGRHYQSKEGISGEITTVNPRENIRLTWKKADWDKPSIVQIRTIPSGAKTTISFHQEKLAHAEIRDEMKAHWETVLDRVKASI
ncbi:SRPBCC domain-containing protein [Paenibacillus lycopersici]|uniref:SRPBCC domain-containing protein n=1 Tax=Paenibacillus lycopersici TaxID=2704462 RepID=A0A6C0G2W5_9BACL|nr:SRPBCC domain-containing protein [Paenibacillus lycopersici]QHT62782.1 SRPBCC domain-containing protein [Paenibacillus lycopersici]